MSHDAATGGGGVSADADPLVDAFYPLYRRLFDEDGSFVGDVDRKLSEARMADTVELYLTRSLAIGCLVGLVLWVLGTLLGYALFALGVVHVGVLLGMPVPNRATLQLINTLKIPVLILVTGLFFGSIGFGTGFGAMVAVPYTKASSRKREINMLLPDAVSFMYALSVGGLNQLEIIEAMAKADDTYGEVAREFRTIVQETEYFDTDYREAIRNQALETPSSDLSQFFTDMLSIINSGGNMTNFLDDKKDKHMRTAKQEQELTLDTLELFGEMYMTLSLFPLLLIIILVVMQMMPDSGENTTMLYATVYGLIPIIGAGFLILVSTVKQDEIGSGYLEPEEGDERLKASSTTLLNLGLVENFVGEFRVFDRIKSREGTYETKKLLRNPHHFFRDNPLFVLGLTVPATLVLVGNAMLAGAAPTTMDGMLAKPVWGTFVYAYLPIFLNLVPLTIFHEWNVRQRRGITGRLSDDLRKLSSANETGMTLLESVQAVSDTSSGKLADEFEVIHAKVEYGTGLREAFVEFNNKYRNPRLARTVKLISKAQEASSQITDVLRTAAQASENADDIAREQKSRSRMQVVIIVMTYLTLLAVMAILKTQFLDVMSGLAGASGGGGDSGSFGGSVDSQLLSMLFFHAVTMQAILSGLISGYISDADILSGMKYVVALSTIALAVWMVVG